VPVPRSTPRWRPATIVGTRRETATARTLRLDVPGWPGHLAGQHVDVRLTAEDGYRATRSYSLSSAAGEAPQITVERVERGEVSGHLVDLARDGDEIEVLGPIGGYFIWCPDTRSAPLLLVAGGSGVAPLRAIWRTARSHRAPVHLVYSARSASRVIYADELRGPDAPATTLHLTREEAPGHAHGRVRSRHLAGLVTDLTRAFVCGPTPFVEDIASALIELGVASTHVRTERFG
jgi:ferredoxin-NADP reductase